MRACAAALFALAASAAQAGAQTPAPADARQALVTVSVAPETVTVGQRFTVKVRVRAPKVAMIGFPDVPPAANGVDPVDPRALADGPAGDVLDRTATYTFAAWDVGPRAPALDSLTVAVAGREQKFAVLPPPVIVRSLLPADTSQLVPRDARDLVALPGRLWQVIVLAVIVAAGLIWWWRRRRAARAAAAGRTIAEAWDEAQRRYAALGAIGLAEAGEPGRHVIAHVDVLRAYLARRFPAVGAGLEARDAVAGLSGLDFPVPVHRVAVLLERDADVRFARAAVAPAEAEALAREARDITAQVQLSHEARLRALERPPRPRRR